MVVMSTDGGGGLYGRNSKRKDRHHLSGVSNKDTTHDIMVRNGGLMMMNGYGDNSYSNDKKMMTIRSYTNRMMDYHTDHQVPITISGVGHKDFTPGATGMAYKEKEMCKADQGSRLIMTTSVYNKDKDISERGAYPNNISLFGIGRVMKDDTKYEEYQNNIPIIHAPPLHATDNEDNKNTTIVLPTTRTTLPSIHETTKKSNTQPKHWFDASQIYRLPLHKGRGMNVWNSEDSTMVSKRMKGTDRLMRATTYPNNNNTNTEDPTTTTAASSPSSVGNDYDTDDGTMVEAIDDTPVNDYQIRPIHLPDLAYRPIHQTKSEAIKRATRVREATRQRYAARPALLQVFRSAARNRDSMVRSRDLLRVFERMGIMLTKMEADLMIHAVDKDNNDGITYDEFCELIYSPDVELGVNNPRQVARGRHVRNITKSLFMDIARKAPILGRKFDAIVKRDRKYLVNKDEFNTVILSAIRHASKEALDMLWSSQFSSSSLNNKDTTQSKRLINEGLVDWRDFMKQTIEIENEYRPPTPPYTQGAKRRECEDRRLYELTDGKEDPILLLDKFRDKHQGHHQQQQQQQDDVILVCDKLVNRQVELPHRPHQCSFKTLNYKEFIRAKAMRAHRALSKYDDDDRNMNLVSDRIRKLNNGARRIAREDLINIIHQTIKPKHDNNTTKRKRMTNYSPSFPHRIPPSNNTDHHHHHPPVLPRIKRSDIESLVATLVSDKDGYVDVEDFLKTCTDDKMIMDGPDALDDRAVRRLRPSKDSTQGEILDNDKYWQGRYAMEVLNEALGKKDNPSGGGGGKLKAVNIFNKLDRDGDGYISLSDIRSSVEHYNVPLDRSDQMAMLKVLEGGELNLGSVDIGQFSRNFILDNGSIMDSMQRQLVGVVHDNDDGGGGLYYGRTNSAPPSSSSPPIHGGPSPHTGRVVVGRISDVLARRRRRHHYNNNHYHHHAPPPPPPTRFSRTMYPDTRFITEPFPGSKLLFITTTLSSIIVLPCRL
ncbi:hypothetical protein FOZ61_003348 [Perkinsus olseni]|uniref:EF-hand domain-containing protein n=1 Tax=Perkinsus olseni TaxID=32597 RepID=A0A7J6LPV5_PEROL|nr:hypothetical protein FOZ61_003348 [Perkinsus olseni]